MLDLQAAAAVHWGCRAFRRKQCGLADNCSCCAQQSPADLQTGEDCTLAVFSLYLWRGMSLCLS